MAGSMITDSHKECSLVNRYYFKMHDPAAYKR